MLLLLDFPLGVEALIFQLGQGVLNGSPYDVKVDIEVAMGHSIAHTAQVSGSEHIHRHSRNLSHLELLASYA